MDNIATSRTSTARWKNTRRQALRAAHLAGQTTCLLCNVPLEFNQAGQPNSAEADHIQPHALGGSDDIENVRIICRHCNQTRSIPKRPRSTNTTVTNLVQW